MSCVLVACASFSTKKKMERLDETVKMFEHALMRSNFMSAVQFLEDTEAMPQNYHDLKKTIKIVNFKPIRVSVSDDNLEVDRDVEIQFFRMDRNILKSIMYRQQWRYQEDIKKWRLTSTLPEFPQQ